MKFIKVHINKVPAYINVDRIAFITFDEDHNLTNIAFSAAHDSKQDEFLDNLLIDDYICDVLEQLGVFK